MYVAALFHWFQKWHSVTKFCKVRKGINTSLHQAVFMGNGFAWAWLGYCLTQQFSGFHFLGPYQWTHDCNWEGSEFIWLWCFSDKSWHCSLSYGSSRAVFWSTQCSGSSSLVLSSLACCASATCITFVICSFSWTQAQATPSHWDNCYYMTPIVWFRYSMTSNNDFAKIWLQTLWLRNTYDFDWFNYFWSSKYMYFLLMTVLPFWYFHVRIDSSPWRFVS